MDGLLLSLLLDYTAPVLAVQKSDLSQRANVQLHIAVESGSLLDVQIVDIFCMRIGP